MPVASVLQSLLSAASLRTAEVTTEAYIYVKTQLETSTGIHSCDTSGCLSRVAGVRQFEQQRMLDRSVKDNGI